MAVKRHWHLSLTKTDSAKVYQFNLPYKLDLWLLVVVAALLLTIAASFVYVGLQHTDIVRMKRLAEENRLLRDKLVSMSDEIDMITAKLKRMESWEDSIRADENLKSINKEIRAMGTGGLPQIDTTFELFDSKLHNRYNKVMQKLNHLQRRSEFSSQTHAELLEKVKLKDEIYCNTPSIYPAFGRISSPYGWRRKHPVTGRRSFHHGIDIANARGTPIYATADGVVEKAKYSNLLGRMIIINHEFGYKTKYGHLAKMLVTNGDKVKKGQIIGLMGASGRRSTGTHIHYEVSHYGKTRNPWYFLNKLEEDIKL
ncbi:MAG: peptidoglycan DD-metalloendopeptidase family protein [Candidatus Cloacimonetes bacterium]|nr:peptidoglycan DD-metalloendopeptidase family protein [Candidatus Cloacimonadota bacterium]